METDKGLVRAYKFKLRPTPTQAEQLEWTLDRCRELYNAAVEERSTAWKRSGISITRAQQQKQLPDVKVVRPEYKQINAQVLQDVIRRVDITFAAFFRNRKEGRKTHYPRYRSRETYHSFTFPQAYTQGVHIRGQNLWIHGIGKTRVHWSRGIEGSPKTASISRQPDGWYVTFTCTDVPVRRLPATHTQIGIDLGIEAFATLSDGTRIPNPHYHTEIAQRLRVLSRKLSRCKRGSIRRKQARKQVAKLWLKSARRMADRNYKLALDLARRYDAIYYEDLQVANMVRNPTLGKSIWGAGWGDFLRVLRHTSESHGRLAQSVPPHFTSQICSGCGSVVKKELSEREHKCPDCGLVLHRDHNAALNVLRLGQSQQALT